jgi:hemin uptake protein HemP
MLRLILFLWIVVFATACSSSRRDAQSQPAPAVAEVVKAKQPSDTAIFYSRGACFGMCPIFELTIMKDGRAVYLGKNHVDRIGRYQTMVSYTDVQKVLTKANEIGYFELKSEYDNESVHDLPDIKTGIAHNGQLYRVRNRYKGPAALRYLYTELDSLIERQDWKAAGPLPQD